MAAGLQGDELVGDTPGCIASIPWKEKFYPTSGAEGMLVRTQISLQVVCVPRGEKERGRGWWRERGVREGWEIKSFARGMVPSLVLGGGEVFMNGIGNGGSATHAPATWPREEADEEELVSWLGNIPNRQGGLEPISFSKKNLILFSNSILLFWNLFEHYDFLKILKFAWNLYEYKRISMYVFRFWDLLEGI
jgi:hypothetical protein